MTDNSCVRKKKVEVILVDPTALGCDHGWERFLQIMFRGIEQFSTEKKHWWLVEDYHRVMYWLTLWAYDQI